MGNSQHEPADGHDPAGAVRVSLGAERALIDRECQTIVNAMHAAGYSDAAQFAVRLAWEEAISNAIHHGNRNRSDGRIDVAHYVDSKRVYLRITDEGEGFDPSAVTDPTLDENLECPSGRGLLLMRAYMTRVDIVPPGNTVLLRLDNPTGR